MKTTALPYSLCPSDLCIQFSLFGTMSKRKRKSSDAVEKFDYFVEHFNRKLSKAEAGNLSKDFMVEHHNIPLKVSDLQIFELEV